MSSFVSKMKAFSVILAVFVAATMATPAPNSVADLNSPLVRCECCAAFRKASNGNKAGVQVLYAV
jgi:hypothetical protein